MYTNLSFSAGCDPKKVESLVSPIVRKIVEEKVELWLHPNQTNGTEKNFVIQEYMTNTGLIASCVRPFELVDIQSMGVLFFRRYFAGRKIFARKSVQGYRISFLFEGNFEGNEEKVLLGWAPLDSFLFADSPTLRVFE